MIPIWMTVEPAPINLCFHGFYELMQERFVDWEAERIWVDRHIASDLKCISEIPFLE